MITRSWAQHIDYFVRQWRKTTALPFCSILTRHLRHHHADLWHDACVSMSPFEATTCWTWPCSWHTCQYHPSGPSLLLLLSSMWPVWCMMCTRISLTWFKTDLRLVLTLHCMFCMRTYREGGFFTCTLWNEHNETQWALLGKWQGQSVSALGFLLRIGLLVQPKGTTWCRSCALVHHPDCNARLWHVVAIVYSWWWTTDAWRGCSNRRSSMWWYAGVPDCGAKVDLSRGKHHLAGALRQLKKRTRHNDAVSTRELWTCQPMQSVEESNSSSMCCRPLTQSHASSCLTLSLSIGLTHHWSPYWLAGTHRHPMLYGMTISHGNCQRGEGSDRGAE